MSRRKKKFIIYGLVGVFAFLLLLLRPDQPAGFKLKVARAASLPMRIVSFPFRELKKILYYHRTFDEYVRLRRETAALKGRLAGMEEVIRENARLKDLLDFKGAAVFSSVAANVVSRDPSTWSSSFVIDRGKKDGVKVGMPVVNAAGVIGKIAEVSDDSAKAILLTDPNFSVAAIVQRSREVGLVSGTLTGRARMRYLSASADVQVGDTVLTSRVSSAFPESVVIGVVAEVKAGGSSPVTECVIEPAAALSQIEEVLVLLMEN